MSEKATDEIVTSPDEIDKPIDKQKEASSKTADERQEPESKNSISDCNQNSISFFTIGQLDEPLKESTDETEQPESLAKSEEQLAMDQAKEKSPAKEQSSDLTKDEAVKDDLQSTPTQSDKETEKPGVDDEQENVVSPTEKEQLPADELIGQPESSIKEADKDQAKQTKDEDKVLPKGRMLPLVTDTKDDKEKSPSKSVRDKAKSKSPLTDESKDQSDLSTKDDLKDKDEEEQDKDKDKDADKDKEKDKDKDVDKDLDKDADKDEPKDGAESNKDTGKDADTDKDRSPVQENEKKGMFSLKLVN